MLLERIFPALVVGIFGGFLIALMWKTLGYERENKEARDVLLLGISAISAVGVVGIVAILLAR